MIKRVLLADFVDTIFFICEIDRYAHMFVQKI